ncbi:hypothetical protein ACT3R9_01425, partial [Psychrobacter sp. AOP42-A1-21]
TALEKHYINNGTAYLSSIKIFDNSYSLFFISTRYLARVNLLTSIKMYQSIVYSQRTTQWLQRYPL